MKRIIISLACVMLFTNVVSISHAKLANELSTNVYELDDSETMGEYKKYLIESFNKRIRETRASLVNNGNTEKILVIPFEFRDVKFKRDSSEYETLLQGLKKYYEINSGYEKNKRGITIGYTIVDKIVSEYDMKHYGTNPEGGLNDQCVSADEMAIEAVEILKSKGFDFCEYDIDKDGIVDHIMIIHAGLGQEETGDRNYIWSHRSVIKNNGIDVGNNIVALNYTTIPENAELGVMAHEFGHDLGLQDLYDTLRHCGAIGSWDIMACGSCNHKKGQMRGECPSNLACWNRELLGWGEIKEIDESGELEFKNTNGISNIYKIYLRDKSGSKNKSEYYLLEYRRKIGFDESLPGEGILIWHIDEDSIQDNYFQNCLNVDRYKMGISLVQADGKFHLTSEDDFNDGDEGDPFPGDNPFNIFGAIPSKLNFDNSGNYSFVEGRNFKLNGDTATMYIDLDIKAPDKKIKTYAPSNESKVGGKVGFCCDYVPKCSEYRLQVSDNDEFLFPMQYNVNGDDYDIEIREEKILFGKNFDNVLEEGKEYYWRIAAVNPITSKENLVWSSPKKMIYLGDKDLEAPSNIRFFVCDSGIKVWWVAEENAKGYVVFCNEEEFYTETNEMELKNACEKQRIRVRSIGEFSASGFGEEIIINRLEPSIKVKVGEMESNLVLPDYILLELNNGKFKKSGNYNESTVSINKLPAGIKIGDILWLDNKTIKVNLDTSYSFVLDKDSKFRVKVSKNLIDDFYGDDLNAEFLLCSNNENHVDGLEFSFSGDRARRIVGIKKDMQYSIDGGIIYKDCIRDDMMLDDDEVESLNNRDGIIIKTNDKRYYLIDILENTRKPILIADYPNNTLRGLNYDMEYSVDGVNWLSYEGDLEKLEDKIWVRYKEHGRVKRSDSVIFNFPSNLEKKDIVE